MLEHNKTVDNQMLQGASVVYVHTMTQSMFEQTETVHSFQSTFLIKVICKSDTCKT